MYLQSSKKCISSFYMKTWFPNQEKDSWIRYTLNLNWYLISVLRIISSLIFEFLIFYCLFKFLYIVHGWYLVTGFDFTHIHVVIKIRVFYIQSRGMYFNLCVLQRQTAWPLQLAKNVKMCFLICMFNRYPEGHSLLSMVANLIIMIWHNTLSSIAACLM